MTSVFPFFLLALVTAVIAVFLKNGGFPVLALTAAVCGGVLILLRLLPFFAEVLSLLRFAADTAGLRVDYLDLVLKVVGIAYIGEFCGQLCRDAGENGVAAKVDLCTKVVIMVMALPLLKTILNTVIEVFQ